MSIPAEFVLITGPMVGASSWAPTAERLRSQGARVEVPDAVGPSHRMPPWRDWTSRLLEQIDVAGTPIIVGHSAASTLAAELATRMPARGLIIVDGDIPAASGSVPPVTRQPFRRLIDSLADEAGALPPWSHWFTDPQRAALSGLDILKRDPAALAAFERDLPRITIDWFDDTIKLAPWEHVPAGYIRTSGFFDHSAEEAQRRGWPTRWLDGTHLDPTLRPDETAAAITAVAGELSTKRRASS
jgi:hypothetical protein